VTEQAAEAQEFPAETTPAASGSPPSFGEPSITEWQKDLHGLLALGELTSSFEWCGHRIVIRTLRTDEELIVASMIKEWDTTLGGAKAYATAMCALAVQAIDGQPMPTPLGETGSKYQWAMERFRYAQRWYPWTIDAVYAQYLQLELRVKEVLAELGKASAPMGAASPGSSGSSGSPSGEGPFTGRLFP